MAMTTKQKYDKIMGTRNTRQAKLDELMVTHDRVEAKYIELQEAKVDIPESFSTKRIDLKRKCTVQRVQVKKSDDDLEALFEENPQFKIELQRELENKRAIEQLTELTKPLTAEVKQQLNAESSGFSMPKPEKEPSLMEQVIEQAEELTKVGEDMNMIRQVAEVQAPVTITIADAMSDKDADYNKWLNETGFQLVERGFGIMSIVGHIIQYHGLSHYQNLDFAILGECDELYSRQIQKQMKHAFHRIAEIKAQ